jgi:hypothetical protein
MAEGDILKTVTNEVVEGAKKRAEETTGHKLYDKKIGKLGLFTRCHCHKFCTIEVGKYLDKRISGSSDEEVAAIFEAEGELYLVFTPSHGLEKGRPYIFRDQEIYSIEEEAHPAAI